MAQCPECGSPLTAGVTEGLCTKCLMAEGVKLASGLAAPAIEAEGAGGPRSFGDYELLEEVARGGMGVVYRARQRSLDRIVAVKLLRFGPHASPEQVKRFRAEATAAASLQHPNIVAIHEVGMQQGEQYLVMDLVDGPNLAGFVKDQPLPPKRAAGYLRTIAEAIQYAHERGILHRDLKPSNVLIGADDQPRVTDFGLAKRMEGESSLTLSGQVLGSPSYMPPEQAGTGHGKVGRRSDVYALGAMLYHALVGRPPFVGEGLNQTLDQVFNSEPVSPRLLNPAVPRDLETICLKCLEKEPPRRYPTAQALADELGRYLRDEPIHARPVSQPERVWRWCLRKPALAALIALVHVVGALGLGGILWQARRAERERDRATQSVYATSVRLASEEVEAGSLIRARALLDHAAAAAGQRQTVGWEWRHFWARCYANLPAVFGNHDSWISAIAVSPDGHWAASLSEDGIAKLWELPAGREVRWLAHGEPSTTRPGYPDIALAFSSDSRTLATAGRDRLVRLWDVHSPERPGVAAPEPLDGLCSGLAFSGQGSLLVALSVPGRVTLWSLADPVPVMLKRWGTGIEIASSLTLSADGKLLATAGFRSPAQLWDVSDPHHPRRVRDFEGTARPVALSPDGRWLVAASSSKRRLRQWDLRTGAEQAPWPERHASLQSLAFSADGEMLASSASDGGIVLDDVARTRAPIVLAGHQDYVSGIAFAPDGKSLLSCSFDRTILRWTNSATARGKRVLDHGRSALGVCFTRDSRYLASVALDNVLGTNGVLREQHTVKLWELPGLTEVTQVTSRGKAWNIYPSFSPEGSLLAVDSRTESLDLFQMPSLNLITNLVGFAPAFVPGSDALYYASGRELLRRDSPAATNAATTVVGESPMEEEFDTLTVSPDGGTAAFTTAMTGQAPDPGIHFWDLDRHQPLGVSTGHVGQVMGLAFSPDSRRLASVSWDGKVGLWDVRTRRRLTWLQGHTGELQALAFSEDGRTLASGGEDGIVRLWSLSTFEEVAALPGDADVFAVSFSPDGQWLAAATIDGRIHLWHAPAFDEIARAQAGKRPVPFEPAHQP